MAIPADKSQHHATFLGDLDSSIFVLSFPFVRQLWKTHHSFFFFVIENFNTIQSKILGLHVQPINQILFSFSFDKDRTFRRTDSRIRRIKKDSATPPGIEPRVLRNLVFRRIRLSVLLSLSDLKEKRIWLGMNPTRASFQLQCTTFHKVLFVSIVSASKSNSFFIDPYIAFIAESALCIGVCTCGPALIMESADTGADTWKKQGSYHMPLAEQVQTPYHPRVLKNYIFREAFG